MPANLPPQYKEAEQRYREAKTTQEKIRALKEMYAIMPKHKGTDKLQADIKRRIAKLNEEVEQVRKGGRRYTEYVKREGAGQVVLAGPPNAGKSSIIEALTHAKPEIGPYPFTTHKPLPAMMPFEDVQIQLVDMPPITQANYEGWMSNIARECDLVLLVLGVDDLDPDGAVKAIKTHLEGAGVELTSQDVRPDEVADYRSVKKKTIVVLNKIDLGESEIVAELVRPVIGDIPIVPVSCKSREGVEGLRQAIYEALRIVRVYTKIPGKKPDMSRPFVVREGMTVIDIARIVHKDFAENLKFARVWGHAKYEGQPVEKHYVLQDRDVLELHL